MVEDYLAVTDSEADADSQAVAVELILPRTAPGWRNALASLPEKLVHHHLLETQTCLLAEQRLCFYTTCSRQDFLRGLLHVPRELPYSTIAPHSTL
jgi:hypothetical protein